MPRIPADTALLGQLARQCAARLLIIDPFVAFLAGVDINRDQDIRQALLHLSRLAGQLGCAIVCVRHLNKGDSAKAVYRGAGSIGVIGHARTGLVVAQAPDNEDERILAVAKSALVTRPVSLRFPLEPHDVGGPQVICRVRWLGTAPYRANQLVERQPCDLLPAKLPAKPPAIWREGRCPAVRRPRGACPLAPRCYAGNMRRLLDRRHFLRLGTVALGSTLLARRARADARRASTCILLYMDGGPSHLDLWDLKPEAPAEVRGPFRPIATTVAGTRVCEHLPRVAAQMHHIAQLRGVRHQASVHDPAVYQMLTGRPHPSTAGGLTVQPSDFPQVGTVYGKLERERAPAVLPRVIELPETMRMEARILPGQNAGFLGASWDPFRVQVTPDAEVVPPELDLAAGVTTRRLTGRRTLLEQLNARRADLELRAEAAELDEFQQQALDLLARPQLGAAFALDQERPALRDRYGRHRHGQSVLLARRLVEAGAGFVTVYWGREPQDWADGRGPRPANNPWDTHRNHFPLLRDDLLPRADQALSALLGDLHQRGMLGSTLVLWMGDFGRTPRIDRRWASRDHWPHANTVLLAGAGVPGGLVHGRTDSIAAEVVEDAVTPADVTATMLHLLGVDTRGTLRDHQGRPHAITEGTPIRALVI